MEKTILIGGKAGQGINLTSHLIGKIFCHLGYYVFEYRDYQSLIRGGHNFNILRISDNLVFSHNENYDFILALDQKTIDSHQKNLKSGGIIVGNKNLNSERLEKIDIFSILKKLNLPPINENNILVGYLTKILGIEKEIVFKVVKKTFQKEADAIKRAIEEGYNLAKEREKIKRIGKEKYYLTGTQGIGLGAIFSGLDIYLAYPMTPTTPLLNFLASRQEKDKILVFQPENEISVINMALGASFAGAKVMVGTSGGGFDLMVEAFSLAGGAEIPIVIYLGQRTGPSTGLPTYTAQGDLKFALSAGHGEFPRIVLAPGDPKEAILRTCQAFYLAQKYRNPVIILSDKHLAESSYSFENLEEPKVSNERFILENPPRDYKSYEIVPEGISKRAVPGQGVIVRANSYEHNEYGNTTEDPKETERMVKKRLKKGELMEKEIIESLNPVNIFGEGKNLVISFGSTKGAILDAQRELKNFKFLQISFLSPFPRETVKDQIDRAEKVIVVENNATSPLADLIAEKTGYFVKYKILKYDGRPFTQKFLVDKIKEII